MESGGGTLDYQRALAKGKGEVEDIGVVYANDSYAGVMRRIAVDLVDATVAVAASAALTALCLYVFPQYSTERQVAVLGAWVGVWFLYFTVLKRSTIRTAGYRLGDVRIVNLKGERPSLFALSVRLLFAVAGPFNILIDLLWIGNDARRQALRDKFAGTYVIRRGAEPTARGPIRYEYYTILGNNFIFAEVRPQPIGAAEAA